MKPIVISFLLLVAQYCQSAMANTVEYQMDNGLKLVVREDHRAPVVVSQVWYKVGGSYEPGGLTGISHMLEHMMFKGTKTLGPGEFSEIVAENGGLDNAFTGADYTTYFQTFGKDRLEISFRLEAERMRDLRLDEAEFAKEQKVVMEERRLRTEDDPSSLLYEQFNASAFMNHPYQNPIIGWMNDIENYRVSDLKAWYERWYSPSNATVVVVGDVEPDAVHKLAKKYFGPIKATPVDPVKPQIEITQNGVRRIVLKKPAQLPYLIMGFHVPRMEPAPSDNAEIYALEALAGVLDGGSSARLSSRLVRGSEIAAVANAGYSSVSRANGMFLLDGTPSPGQEVKKLEHALLEEIRLMREELVSETELQRVKNQIIAAEVYQQDSVFYQGMRIGRLETVGLDWRMMDDYVEGIKKVTPQQILEAANKYLQEDQLTIAELVPLPMDNKSAAAPKSTGGRHGG